MTLAPTLVVGTGLVGTSVALALQAAGRLVVLADSDEAALALAVARGAGRPLGAADEVSHVVLAVPPSAVAEVLRAALASHVGATVSDVCSIKSLAALEIEKNTPELARYVGGHPLAGSERGGPAAARPDLFVGRPWAITPHLEASPVALAAARSVAVDCGAQPIVLTPEAHDEAVGLVSHLPQAAASALAATVGQHASQEAFALVGQGLRDSTRIAASPPQLWAQILGRNARAVAPFVNELAERLAHLGRELGRGAGEAAVTALLTEANAAVGRLPGKHSTRREAVDVVIAVLKDAPGALASLLADAHTAGVNVEDIRIEHAQGAAIGAARLLVLAGRGDGLAAALSAAGWSVSVEADEPAG
ncbi:MAG: prephenate dehydrogenase [Frankiaceae bacterium]|jgi:prephenate dehydrogenase|nr:prephenate dehydrogenase [Frankiaceae bacterium]